MNNTEHTTDRTSSSIDPTKEAVRSFICTYTVNKLAWRSRTTPEQVATILGVTREAAVMRDRGLDQRRS